MPKPIYREYLSVGRTYFQPTPPDIEGPFYKAGALVLGDSKMVEAPTLHLRGRVLGLGTGRAGGMGWPLAGARLDFWQADEKGVYDNEGYNFRGVILADGQGRYNLLTVRPGDYKIDEHEFRCAHIHVKVTLQGYRPLTTQLYFPDDPYNATDRWFDSRRVVTGDGIFDFVLESLTNGR